MQKTKEEENIIWNNSLKKEKGITLIALVITIIVMLILVAVTINIAVNGGLFEYAGRAARDTETKKQEEQDFANLKANAKMPKGTYMNGRKNIYFGYKIRQITKK